MIKVVCYALGSLIFLRPDAVRASICSKAVCELIEVASFRAKHSPLFKPLRVKILAHENGRLVLVERDHLTFWGTTRHQSLWFSEDLEVAHDLDEKKPSAFQFRLFSRPTLGLDAELTLRGQAPIGLVDFPEPLSEEPYIHLRSMRQALKRGAFREVLWYVRSDKRALALTSEPKSWRTPRFLIARPEAEVHRWYSLNLPSQRDRKLSFDRPKVNFQNDDY